MKKVFITILVSFLFQQWLYCQEVSFPFRTYLILRDMDTIKNPEFVPLKLEFLGENKKRYAQSIVLTKLDSSLMNKIYQNFIQHVKLNTKVKSYYFPKYDIGVKELYAEKIAALNNSNSTQQFNKYYLFLEYEELEWSNEGTGYKNWVQITSDSRLRYSCDSTVVQSNLPPYEPHDTVICQYMGPENTEGLQFVEIWNFNKATGIFAKKTEFVTLNAYDPVRGTLPLLSFKSNSEVSEIVFKKNMQYDVFFDLWNTCNPYGEEFSCESVQAEFCSSATTTNYINTENRTELILNIFNAVEAGTLIPLEIKSFDKGKEKALKIDQMYNCMEFPEKVKIMNTYPPYEEKDTTVIRLSQFSDIIGIRFIEDWSFDAQNFNFYKKVKTFALLFAQYDMNTGELIGYKPYFFLKPKN